MSERLQDLASGRSGADKKGLEGWVAGRCRRREYWLWIGPFLVIMLILAALEVTAGSLLLGLPILFVWIRRLHDMGFSGWLAPLINIGVNISSFGAMALLPPAVGGLIAVVAYLGALVTLGAWPGEAHANAYGPRPGGKTDDLAATFG